MVALAIIHDARKCYEILGDENPEQSFVDSLNIVNEKYLKAIKPFQKVNK